MIHSTSNSDDVKVKKRREILLCGKEKGVSFACKQYNISRTLYYRWLKRFEADGLDGLKDRLRTYVPPNKSNYELEILILNAIEDYPKYGPQSISWLIEEQNIKLSASGVYNIMCRHGLNHKHARIKYSRKIKNISVNIDKIEFKQEIPDEYKLISGELWMVWTENLGYQKGIGTIYQYSVVDVKSGMACSRLYTRKNSECAMDLLLGVAIPMGTELLMKPTWIMTQHQQEYTSGQIHSLHLYSKKLKDLKIKQLIWEQKNDLYSKTVQVFTKKTRYYLNDLLSSCSSFEALKEQFQEFLRIYNIDIPLGYGVNCMKTPIEIVMAENHGTASLPLWFYVNRAY